MISVDQSLNSTTSTVPSDIKFFVTGSEVMRIQNNGEVGLNISDPAANLHVASADMANTRDALRLQNLANNTGGYFIRFNNHSGGVAGYIEQTGATSVNLVTSSDYRLKENIVLMSNSIVRLKKLLPKRFNFITEPDTTIDGFLAHEVSHDADGNPLVPFAVSGEKDAMNDDGSIKNQCMDSSKSVSYTHLTLPTILRV